MSDFESSSSQPHDPKRSTPPAQPSHFDDEFSSHQPPTLGDHQETDNTVDEDPVFAAIHRVDFAKRASNLSRDTDENADRPWNYHADTTPNGLLYFHGSSKPSDREHSILDIVGIHPNLCFLINAKAAQLNEVGELFSADNDLLSSFPDDVRQQNSLHLFHSSDERAHSVLASATRGDAVIGLVSEHDVDTLPDKLKMVLAWFVKSSALKFHLEKGNEFFIDGIFSEIKMVMLHEPNRSNKWFLFHHPKAPLTWQELGFPQAPSAHS